MLVFAAGGLGGRGFQPFGTSLAQTNAIAWAKPLSPGITSLQGDERVA